jgi:hypothetical protein
MVNDTQVRNERRTDQWVRARPMRVCDVSIRFDAPPLDSAGTNGSLASSHEIFRSEA